MPNAGSFKKGEKRPNQGKRGPGKFTGTVKSAFEAVFRDLQADPKKPYALGEWAKIEPQEFYKLAAKLIPQDIKASVQGNLTVTPNVNLIVEAMGGNIAGGLKKTGAITVTTEPQGVNGRKPD